MGPMGFKLNNQEMTIHTLVIPNVYATNENPSNPFDLFRCHSGRLTRMEKIHIGDLPTANPMSGVSSGISGRS